MHNRLSQHKPLKDAENHGDLFKTDETLLKNITSFWYTQLYRIDYRERYDIIYRTTVNFCQKHNHVNIHFTNDFIEVD